MSRWNLLSSYFHNATSVNLPTISIRRLQSQAQSSHRNSHHRVFRSATKKILEIALFAKDIAFMSCTAVNQRLDQHLMVRSLNVEKSNTDSSLDKKKPVTQNQSSTKDSYQHGGTNGTCDESDSSEYKHDHTCHNEFLYKDIPMPPPLPSPKYSFHRRILPPSLTQMSSPQGKVIFRESLLANDAEAYFPLAEQFVNQSEPSYCAVASLTMVLNAFGIDPKVRWKGGWRWYGSEDMILGQCCIDAERVRRVGVLLEEFASLGRCQGLNVIMKRPLPLDPSYRTSQDTSDPSDQSSYYYSLEEFRSDIIRMCRNPPLYEPEDSARITDEETDLDSSRGFMVVSFSRQSLGQTGDGHYSPIGAYHRATDQCLVLDVARFKYAPYWVSVKDLYEATRPKDTVTDKSRGWFLMFPTVHTTSTAGTEHDKRNRYTGAKVTDERKILAHLVPSVEDGRLCPIGTIKVEYCLAKSKEPRDDCISKEK